MQQTTKSNGLNWLALSVIIFLADVGSKFIVLSQFDLYDSVNLLPFFSLTYVQNFGAAFSFFLGQRWILAIIAIAMSLFIIRLLYKSPKEEKLANCSYALILGGAIGNLFDRLYHGFVVDFFDFFIGTWHYPIFNISDISICVGVGLLLISSFMSKKREKQE